MTMFEKLKTARKPSGQLRRRSGGLVLWTAALTIGLLPVGARAETDVELAQQLSNPVSSLISVPFQFNYDDGIGPSDGGSRVLLNLQPVIPFSLGNGWNLISRTIVPVAYQTDIFPGAGSQRGLGDTVQSLFLSPKAPTSGGLIWGAGPVFLLPTATDDLLGGEKWGVGPTGVMLTQRGPWTIGGLANHIWSVGGANDRSDIDRTFLQPFVTYTTSQAWSFSLQTESSYDWEAEQWSVPVNVGVSKLTKVGGAPVSFSGGLRYWVKSPDNGPEGWGLRFGVTLLFPRG